MYLNFIFIQRINLKAEIKKYNFIKIKYFCLFNVKINYKCVISKLKLFLNFSYILSMHFFDEI